MNKQVLFFIGLCFSFFILNMAPITAETVQASAAETTDSTTGNAIRIHIVCANNHNTPIPNTAVSFKNPGNGETVSGTTDAEGNIALDRMNPGTYNVYVTDTYGNYVSAETSVVLSSDAAQSLLVSVPLARLQVTYQNSSSQAYQAPSYTISGAFDKTYRLDALAAGTSIINDSGFVINGASYLIAVQSEKGRIEQRYFAVPFRTSDFGIQIYDRNVSIFVKHI